AVRNACDARLVKTVRTRADAGALSARISTARSRRCDAQRRCQPEFLQLGICRSAFCTRTKTAPCISPDLRGFALFLGPQFGPFSHALGELNLMLNSLFRSVRLSAAMRNCSLAVM